MRQVINVQVTALDEDQCEIVILDSTTPGISWTHKLIHSKKSDDIKYECPECSDETGNPKHGSPETNWIENIVQNIFPDWEIQAEPDEYMENFQADSPLPRTER